MLIETNLSRKIEIGSLDEIKLSMSRFVITTNTFVLFLSVSIPVKKMFCFFKTFALHNYEGGN